MKNRVGTNQHQQKGGSGNISLPSEKGQTRDIAAAAIGISGKTLEKIGDVTANGIGGSCAGARDWGYCIRLFYSGIGGAEK